jgi:hypothetical protein
MATPYPFGLSTVISTSKARSQPAAFRVSEARRGFAYFQASGTDTPVFWDVIFRFRKCDAVNFIMWFTQDLDRGVLDFDLPIKTEFGLLTHTCRFMSDALLDARELGDVFEYRAQIVARAQIIPVDAVTEWNGAFAGPIANQFLSQGVPYTLSLAGYFTGGLGPFTYGIFSGGLPAGVTLNEISGVVSGTPTEASAVYPDVVFYRVGAYCIRKYTNAIDFTVANEAASTWDPVIQTGVWSFSLGNKRATAVSGAVKTTLGTIGRSSGKRYFEIVRVSGGEFSVLVRDEYGATRERPPAGSNSLSQFGLAWRRAGAIFSNGTNIATVAQVGANGVVCVAIDFAASKAWLGLNGAWLSGANPALGIGATITSLTAGTYYPASSSEASSALVTDLRTSYSEFAYPVPDGFTSWATI